MSRISRLTGQIGGFTIFIVVLGFGFSLRAVAAQPPVDIRGEWAVTTTVATTNYPQTLEITSEDFSSGQIGGTDTGSGGDTFAMTGVISGSTVNLVISDVNYTSNTTATISGVSSSMQMTGTFSDSHNVNGTFSAKLTVPAVIVPPPSGSSVTPVMPTVTPNGQATTVASTVVVVGVTTPTDTNPPSDDLPLLPLGLAALLLLGLGGAAAAGLVPGVSGLGGSSVSSGAGSSETLADNTAGQQIERGKIMQDARPSIMPTLQATPTKLTSPDPLTSPGDQGLPASGQQTERYKIMQDQRPSIMPNQSDSSINKPAPTPGPADRADPFIRAEAPLNPTTAGDVASTGDVPTDGSPLA